MPELPSPALETARAGLARLRATLETDPRYRAKALVPPVPPELPCVALQSQSVLLRRRFDPLDIFLRV